jgi:hypothetical protein
VKAAAQKPLFWHTPGRQHILRRLVDIYQTA